MNVILIRSDSFGVFIGGCGAERGGELVNEEGSVLVEACSVLFAVVRKEVHFLLLY